MTTWTRQALATAAAQYADNKARHLLFKTKAVPPPWSDELQHGVDLPVWDNELSALPDDALIFVIESEPEPALLVQTIQVLRSSIDHQIAGSRQFPNGGVFWPRYIFKCLIGTPAVSPMQQQPNLQQLELFQ
jgi:hypothetical protein